MVTNQIQQILPVLKAVPSFLSHPSYLVPVMVNKLNYTVQDYHGSYKTL